MPEPREMNPVVFLDGTEDDENVVDFRPVSENPKDSSVPESVIELPPAPPLSPPSTSITPTGQSDTANIGSPVEPTADLKPLTPSNFLPPNADSPASVAKVVLPPVTGPKTTE